MFGPVDKWPVPQDHPEKLELQGFSRRERAAFYTAKQIGANAWIFLLSMLAGSAYTHASPLRLIAFSYIVFTVAQVIEIAKEGRIA